MAVVKKSIKVRLYPAEKQKVLIDKTIGCARFAYNQTLEDCKRSYKQSKHFPSQNERIKNLVLLKETHTFLKEVDSQALQQSVRDFNAALGNFFRNRRYFGFPKFKSKHNNERSYRTTCCGDRARVFDSKHVMLPKLGKVRTKSFSMPEGYKAFNITVIKTNAEKYYASSKICSYCGAYHKDIVDSLSVREWICLDCGAQHDRDVNAARNILNRALGVGY